MFDVIFLNANLETEYRCKVIDYLWDSKLYEPGEYQIQVLNDNDLDLDVCKYVITNTKKEIGIIERWEYNSQKLNTVIISGYFFEQQLYRSVIYPTYIATGKTIWQIANEICSTYLDDWGFDLTLPVQPIDGVITEESKNISYQQTGDYVGDALYDLAATYGYGISITKNGTGLSINVTNYHDRTQGDDDEVVFSVARNSIKNFEIVKDKSNYRNVAIVAGEGEGSARIVEVVNIAKEGETRSHLWVDARDLQRQASATMENAPANSEQGTTAYSDTSWGDQALKLQMLLYRSQLRQRGLEKLADYVEIDNIEIEIESEEAEKVGIDFEIGDIVWVIINPYNLSYKMKIIEVEDVYNEGRRTVSLVFGDKIPSKLEKAGIR